MIIDLAAVGHGGFGRKQKVIIRRGSTMAAGQTGKVPGAPPRNPTTARSRETRRRKKYLKLHKTQTVEVEGEAVLWNMCLRPFVKFRVVVQ